MSFRRKTFQRDPYPIMVIACEGETERIYIEQLARYLGGQERWHPKILPHSTKTSALSVVQKVSNEKKKQGIGEQDCFFAVFDGDKNIDSARKCAEENGIRTIVSLPCFEYWILLHLKKTDKPYQGCEDVGGEVAKEAKKIGLEYQKTDESFHRKIVCDYLSEARKNAESLDKSTCSRTDMATLVKHLEDTYRLISSLARPHKGQ